ncbi:MAG: serine/threonine protein kinase [Actinobacteria bacterium]|nr:serine/threonine protein kinase [Actinomycetota bacterium]
MSATLPGANPASLPPAILAQRYRLERRLAQGGMAEVWLGTDLSLSRQVAVKLLKPNLAADPVVAERFRREAIAVAQLSHPNIVAVYDAIEETIGGERRQAVVMQLVNGKSLRQLLDEQKRLSPDLTMHIGACVASALDSAHRANLVHRDVKPGNILITPDGRVLLTDFGIAKGLTGTADDDLTSPNVMMGTAKYLSPEQVRGRKLDGRADLYSLGLVLYECLAGRVPFLGETDADTALARLNREATDLTRLRPTLPLGLAPLIHKLLARRPDDRYASGADVRAELQRIASQPRTDHDVSRDVTRAGTVTGEQRGGTTTIAATGTTGSTPTLPSPTGPAARRSGQVPTVTGQQPLKAGRPAAPAVRADKTPPATRRPVQQPNRKFQHRTGPSMAVVGGLLAAALVVGLVLWITMGTDSSDGVTVPSTVVPSDSTAVSTPATATGSIVAVHSFDPDGNDRTENEPLVPQAFDGNPATEWHTVCYSDKYLGGKSGVGLVVDLGAAATGTLTVDIGSAPYQVRVLAAPDGQEPSSFNGFTTEVDSFNGTEPRTVSATLTSPARWLLVSFVELGANNDCANNPYRGAIRELAFG